MRSFIAVLLIAFLVSGFSWGDQAQDNKNAPPSSREVSQTPQTPQRTGSSSARTSSYRDYSAETPVSSRQPAASNTAARTTTAAAAELDTGTSRNSREVATHPQTSSPTSGNLTAPAAAGATGFPTELISSLASGDEATRRARIESLKRLSQALTRMRTTQQQQQQQQGTASAPAQTKAVSSRDKNRT